MTPSPEPNWANKTIWTGDNLFIMRGMNSESVDLIYLDPPFNSKSNYAAPIGSQAAGAAFRDTWTLSDLDVEWINLIEQKHPALYRVLLAAMSNSDKSYLVYMAVRLLEMKRILKPTGSIYLHCDPTMSHYLKLVMDAVFGRKNFRNEIVWCYTGPSNSKRYYPRKHDVLLFYISGGGGASMRMLSGFLIAMRLCPAEHAAKELKGLSRHRRNAPTDGGKKKHKSVSVMEKSRKIGGLTFRY